jgi:hypothetical protein
MSARIWNAAFAFAAAAYLVLGTALLAKAMNAQGDDAVMLLVAGEALLLVAAFTAPGWWAVSLPLVTFFPVGAWGVSECEPGFLDLCGLVWYASAFVAIVIGLPVAAVGSWLGHGARERWASDPSTRRRSQGA